MVAARADALRHRRTARTACEGTWQGHSGGGSACAARDVQILWRVSLGSARNIREMSRKKRVRRTPASAVLPVRSAPPSTGPPPPKRTGSAEGGERPQPHPAQNQRPIANDVRRG